jgi:hypothetical protein
MLNLRKGNSDIGTLHAILLGYWNLSNDWLSENSVSENGSVSILKCHG